MMNTEEELLGIEIKTLIFKEEVGHQHMGSSCIQPPLQYPWLLFTTGGKSDGYICCTSPLYIGYSTSLFYSDLRIDKVFNCCYGWIIFLSYDERFFLWNPVKSRLVQLPPLELRRYHHILDAVLMSSPCKSNIGTDELDPNCMVLLFEYTFAGPVCIRYLSLREKAWNSVCYGVADIDLLINPTLFNDAVYALRGLELVCISHVNSTGIIATNYDKLPVPQILQYPNSVGTVRRLVESCGELFFIVLYWADYHNCDVETIEAFKLDQVSKTWHKVRDVGDRVFVFDEKYCISSRAASGEMKGGSMCYVSHFHSCLFSYSFVNNTVSTSLLSKLFNLPDARPRHSCILYLPDTRLIDGPPVKMNLVEHGHYKAANSKIKGEPEDVMLYDESGSYYFPNELLARMARLLIPVITFINICLNPIDYNPDFRFALTTCKVYAPPISPCLIWTDNRSNLYNFVDSELGRRYFNNIPESLVDTKTLCSSNGWLLISTKFFEKFSMCNPFTGRIVELPKPPLQFNARSNIGLWSSPASSKCIVVSMFEGEIHFLVVGSKNWQRYPFLYFDLDSYYSPTFHDGSFWFVGHCDDSLGVFNVEDDGQVSWKIHFITKEDRRRRHLKRFLVSCGGNLLLVAIGLFGKPVEVFVLNQTAMAWEILTDLGNHALYLSRSSSFSTRARAEWMRNIIFLPRVVVNKDRIVFYSMDTGKYHTFVNNDKSVEYEDTAEPVLSTWIQPSWC